MIRMSDDKQSARGYDLGPVFGVACYEGPIIPDDSSPTGFAWEARHVGVVADEDQARRWLDGEPVELQRIYKHP